MFKIYSFMFLVGFIQGVCCGIYFSDSCEGVEPTTLKSLSPRHDVPVSSLKADTIWM